MDCSKPVFPVLHCLPELAQTHVHLVSDAIQTFPSVFPFSSCLQSFPASGSFPMSQFLTSVAKILELQLPWWLRWSSICLQCGRPGFYPWVGKIPWRRERLPKNWCFGTVELEKTLEKSLGLQGDPASPSWRKSVLNIHWKDWCWSFNTWPPDAKSWFIRKDPDAGKDWRQEEKGTTEDEMVGWHHWLNGHEFE